MGDSKVSSRPEPTASGALAKTPLVHLLLYALERKLTGTIELFSSDKRTAAVYFVRGLPAKVRTSEPVAYLGAVLRQLGFLDEGTLDRSLAELAKAKRSGRMLHGQLLIALGAIDASKLRIGLEEQIGRKLRHVATMPPDTKYGYYDAFDALQGWGGDEPTTVDPLPLLWAMVNENPPAEHVTAALARVGGAPLRLARGADPAKLGLGSQEKATVDLLRARPMRMADLANATILDEAALRQLAYVLLVTKQVEVLAAGDSPRPPAASVPPAGRVSQPSPVPARSSPVPPDGGPRVSRPSIPPGGRASPPPAPPPPDLAPELAERWKDITARAATIDRADYFMMLDVARDATKDDVESAFLALAKRWHPDRLPAELAPVRDACSRVFARMSEARATLVDDEQRARYMNLLADGSGSPEMQETVAKVVEAATNFQKADVCFKRNDLAQAEQFCRLALEADPTQPDYHAMLAWLTALKPESQSEDKTLACIKMLDKAVAMSNRCERAYYWRGMLFKRLGKSELAAKDFKRVVDLNPRNIDAAREVRLQNMRGGRGSNPPPPMKSSGPASTRDGAAKTPEADKDKGGFFGRLFKK